MKDLISITEDMLSKDQHRYIAFLTLSDNPMYQNIAKTQGSNGGRTGRKSMHKQEGIIQLNCKFAPNFFGRNEPVIYRGYRWFQPKVADQQANGEISWSPSVKSRLWKVPLSTPLGIRWKIWQTFCTWKIKGQKHTKTDIFIFSDIFSESNRSKPET